ncbi:sensory rhodopsin transducer [Diplocloster modestus]|uniref:Sensory rhodopsin transducer n=1 Tax=Diplocloster modestus TaxID=2850322 RepID=A0ABS6KA42_9FIRM|nr:sensory rhodopsin transducer [Diplocloster modestus]MBU9727362.1 hypothetical protein [Diplocloster modestus]
MELGKKTWVFADGDLPPQGEVEPLGHEALMIVNNTEKDAEITLDLLFEDQDPKEGIKIKVKARRVHCFRMDYPIGEEQYLIPKGQFAVILNSNVPVVAVYGRLDRRKDMAYYPVTGFSV